MSFGIGVNLPTVTSFLMLYSLYFGSVVICSWTLLRATFFVLFFLWAPIAMASPTPVFGKYLPMRIYPPPDTMYPITMFAYLVVFLNEAFLILFTFDLAAGIFFEEVYRIERYLICRFIVWIMELIFITTMSVAHTDLLKLYLMMLICVILEFYGFMVVFSYFKDVKDDPLKCPAKHIEIICTPQMSD